MEKGHFKMSVKEIDRIGVMEKLVTGKLKVNQAAETLQLSNRQVKRLKKRFRDLGPKGLIHQNRGRVGNRQISQLEIERASNIVAQNYADFGPTLALEKLKENHGVTFGRERLRLAMIEKGLWKVKKKRYVVVHQQRRRRDREGELVQADGSPHFWFEDRGPYCTLLVFVDDATGKLKHLMFAQAETTNNYFVALAAYIRQFGKPAALYVDKHSVFRVNTRRSATASVDDNNGQTQFGRAMGELNITLIFANSPQAKGRVEKINSTLQDRLVKEMRLRGISSLAEGNAFLAEFMDRYNRKFAVSPYCQDDAHRPLLPSENLENTLVKKETRVLSKNLEFMYQNRLYQIKTDRPPYSMRQAKVTVFEDTNGQIAVHYKGQKLKYAVTHRQPDLKIADPKEIYQEVEKAVKKPWKPAQDHPWKNYSF